MLCFPLWGFHFRRRRYSSPPLTAPSCLLSNIYLRRFSSTQPPPSPPPPSPLMVEVPAQKAQPSAARPKDKAHLEIVISKRISLFQAIKAQQIAHRQSIAGYSIKITLPDGIVKEGKKWISLPLDIAEMAHNAFGGGRWRERVRAR